MSDLVKLVSGPSLSDVAEYAYAAVVQGPNALVFTAGACPLDEHGRTVALGDPAGQAARTMRNLTLALGDAGATLADVVKSTVYVATTDQADLIAVWKVVSQAFGDHDAPSTLVGVTVLGYDGQLVEIEAIAAVGAT